MCALPWQTKQREGRDSGGVVDEGDDEGAVDRRPAHPPVEQEGERGEREEGKTRK